MNKKIAMKKRHLMSLVIGLALAVGGGCDAHNQAKAPPPPEVGVSKPAARQVVEYAYFTGNTQAKASVDIRARVSGYLEKIHFIEGDMVAKGDLLFEIDPRPFIAKLKGAKADLMRRKAELKLAETTLARRKSAYTEKAVSEVDVLEAEAEKDQAKADLEAARAREEACALDLAYTKIHAPFSGRIGRRLVDPGSLVGADGRTVLARITQLKPIYAYFHVNEKEVLRYRQGNPNGPSPINGKAGALVELGLGESGGFPYRGELDFNASGMDGSTGTLLVRAVFPNGDHRLLPGHFARLRVPLGKARQALLVPERALGSDQQGRFLLVVNGSDQVERRAVSLGEKIASMRVVKKGLEPTDRVVTKGIIRARPGSKVKPVEARADGPAVGGRPPAKS